LLRVQQLSVNGRRDELLPATSLQVRRGELLLVSDKRQTQRTALALALSGRLKPSAGHFEWDDEEWDGSARIKTLRQASAVVDSPGVNEPEQHLSVRDLVTEDLALIPRRYRGSLLSKPWLKVNRFEDIAGLWTEQLPAARRLELLTALALTNPHTDLLVVDSPDRHGDPDDWLPRLQELAYDAGRPLAVVATVMSVPAGWTGPAAAIGNAESAAPGDPAPERLHASNTLETEEIK
jgi:ABC-type branched-subunit amino acid transport system ATPase component